MPDKHSDVPKRPTLSENEITIVALGYAEPELVEVAFHDGPSRDKIYERGFTQTALDAADEEKDGKPTAKATAYRDLFKRMGIKGHAPSDADRELQLSVA